MSDTYLLALHALTLRQLADPTQVAAILDLNVDDATTALEKAVADGAAFGARGSFMISPTGRATLDETYPEWFATERASDDVTAAMDSFETGVNKQILSLTTDWQTVEVNGERQPNDHGDADYDAKIIGKIGTVVDRTEGVLSPLAELQPTVRRFLDRIGAALTRAESGETDYVSSVRVDSVHTVWFQMHEHILRITGRERPE